MDDRTTQPRLRVLGTGDSTSLRFWNSGYLVEARGKRLLIDCGFTIKYALRDVGLTLADVEAVFITHVHGDHVHGLERLGYESRYGFHKRACLLLAPGIRHELWDLCLQGTMGSSSDGRNALEDFFDVRALDGGPFEWEGVRFEPFPTPHTPNKPSYGLIINDRLIITSDTRPIDWLARDASERIIIHDCALGAGNPVHAGLDELLQLYPPAVRRRLWAIHYGDRIEEYRARIEAEFAGVAQRGQCFAI
jgi:ribonuclease BN (tRNA processing enzyme)